MLITAHLAAGNRGAALRQFEQCRRVLHEELGLEPSQALRDLVPSHPSHPPHPSDAEGAAPRKPRRLVVRRPASDVLVEGAGGR